MTTIDHVINASTVVSSDPPNSISTTNINNNKNHSHDSMSLSDMDAQPGVIVAQNGPSVKLEQYANPTEQNGIERMLLLNLPKASDQHSLPLTPSDSLLDYHPLSGYVSDTTSPLTALAIIAQQHSVQVGHRTRTVLGNGGSCGSAANNAEASVSLPVTVSHVQPTAVDLNRETAGRTIITSSSSSSSSSSCSSSSKAACEFYDVSKVESRTCDVCGEPASGHYFRALVCLPCKSFFIRCTKGGDPVFSADCGGKCDVIKSGRIRCQFCRFQRCLSAGMYRKEKPEAVVPEEGQVLCQVCSDIANGVHFGVTTCEGCKKFFRRGLKEHHAYVCKVTGNCTVNPRMRNSCRYCRYQKCLRVGMSREAIKMGRPKKGDLSCWRSSKPSPMDAETRNQDNKSAMLSQIPIEEMEDKKNAGSCGAEEALESKFALEAVYDSTCTADEFLEAVSMGLDQEETGVKTEPSVAPAPPVAVESTQVVTSVSSGSASSSPVDRGAPSRSTSSGSSAGVGRSGPFSPLSEDTFLMQTCPYPTLSPAVSSSGFPQKEAYVSNPLPQMSAHAELSEWLTEEEAMSSNDSVTSEEYPDTGHTPCCALSAAFLDTPSEECGMSPPCFCRPCCCSPPISDCESPCCAADYRSQLQFLPSPLPNQQFHRSSRQQLPLSYVHDGPELMDKQMYMPAVSHTYGDQLTTSQHILSTAPFPSLLRQQCVAERKEGGQVSVIRRHRALSSCVPYCSSDRRSVVGIPTVASSSHRPNESVISKPSQKLLDKHLEETCVDELDSLLESLRERYWEPTNTVKNNGIPTPTHCINSSKQALNHPRTSKLFYNRGISFDSTSQGRQDNGRNSSECQSEYEPERKLARFCPNLNKGEDSRDVVGPWTHRSPIHYQPDAIGGRRWSGTSKQQHGCFVPPAQQLCRGSLGLRLPRSFSQNSLYHSSSDFSSAHPPVIPHVSVRHSSWQYGAQHFSPRMKQGGVQHGNSTAMQSQKDYTVLLPASEAAYAAGKEQIPSVRNTFNHTGANNSSIRAAFSASITDGSDSIRSSVDPLAGVLPFLPSAVSQRHDLNSLAGVPLTTTASGNSGGINMVSSAAGFGNSSDAFKTRPASSNVPSGGASITNLTPLQPNTSVIHVSQQLSPQISGNLPSSHSNMPAVRACQQSSPQMMISGQTSSQPNSLAAPECQRYPQKPTHLTLPQPNTTLCQQQPLHQDYSLGLSTTPWLPAPCGPNVAGTLQTCPAATHLSPLAAKGAPAVNHFSCPSPFEEASSARTTAHSLEPTTGDLRKLEDVNRYFLTLENTCEKNSCKQDSADEEEDVCQSQGCQGCRPSRDGGDQSTGFNPKPPGFCLRRCHRYWHGYRPPTRLGEVETGEQKQQQYMASVVSAFCQLREDLRQLDNKTGLAEDKAERVMNTSDVLHKLHQQRVAIAAMSRRFLLAIPGGNTIATEDLDILSDHFGFSLVLILLSTQGFDPEARRFREVLKWTVGPTCPLFCFKVQLLAAASSLHGLCMDRTETALLCALSLCSTDTRGLKDKTAIRDVRCQLLNAFESSVSSRDQSCRERVERLFSVLPNVRLVSAWFCALLSHTESSTVHSQLARDLLSVPTEQSV
ncbi:hypothetical protein ACOMHN_042150 [Nucella lapillus]